MLLDGFNQRNVDAYSSLALISLPLITFLASWIPRHLDSFEILILYYDVETIVFIFL